MGLICEAALAREMGLISVDSELKELIELRGIKNDLVRLVGADGSKNALMRLAAKKMRVCYPDLKTNEQKINFYRGVVQETKRLILGGEESTPAPPKEGGK
jgi:hypothetical protein